ncbi:MAG TPA: deoxyribose-phosphate aldolase [Limnochordales bacterium]
MEVAEGLAGRLEQALLRADATAHEVEQLCRQAAQWGVRGVCVLPVHVARARRCLEGSPVRVVAAVGFPLGASSTLVKVVEAVQCVGAGAHEVDVVIALWALKAGQLDEVERDLQAVVRAVGPQVPVKAILETPYLSGPEKAAAALAARACGARYVKTSTGFGPGGATVEDVRLLREVLGDQVGVKASGGVRRARQALELLRAGADLIGTSHGFAILQELQGLPALPELPELPEGGAAP